MLFVEKVKTKMGRACLVTRVSCFSRSTSKRELIYLNISVARVLLLLVRARSLEISYHSRFSKPKVSLRVSCTFGPRISLWSIEWSFFCRKYARNKWVLTRKASNFVFKHQSMSTKIVQKLDNTSTRMRTTRSTHAVMVATAYS